jgi:gentisate 1,2-dioxygenase
MRTKIRSDDAIVVPAGAPHNVVNTGRKPMKLYTSTDRPSIKTGSFSPPRAKQRPGRSISTARPRNNRLRRCRREQRARALCIGAIAGAAPYNSVRQRPAASYLHDRGRTRDRIQTSSL